MREESRGGGAGGGAGGHEATAVGSVRAAPLVCRGLREGDSIARNISRLEANGATRSDTIKKPFIRGEYG